MTVPTFPASISATDAEKVSYKPTGAFPAATGIIFEGTTEYEFTDAVTISSDVEFKGKVTFNSTVNGASSNTQTFTVSDGTFKGIVGGTLPLKAVHTAGIISVAANVNKITAASTAKVDFINTAVVAVGTLESTGAAIRMAETEGGAKVEITALKSLGKDKSKIYVGKGRAGNLYIGGLTFGTAKGSTEKTDKFVVEVSTVGLKSNTTVATVTGLTDKMFESASELYTFTVSGTSLKYTNEYKIAVSDGTKNYNCENWAAVVKKIEELTADDYTVTLFVDVPSTTEVAMPKNAKSVTIDANGCTFAAKSKVSAAYDLTLIGGTFALSIDSAKAVTLTECTKFTGDVTGTTVTVENTPVTGNITGTAVSVKDSAITGDVAGTTSVSLNKAPVSGKVTGGTVTVKDSKLSGDVAGADVSLDTAVLEGAKLDSTGTLTITGKLTLSKAVAITAKDVTAAADSTVEFTDKYAVPKITGKVTGTVAIVTKTAFIEGDKVAETKAEAKSFTVSPALAEGLELQNSDDGYIVVAKKGEEPGPGPGPGPDPGPTPDPEDPKPGVSAKPFTVYKGADTDTPIAEVATWAEGGVVNVTIVDAAGDEVAISSNYEFGAWNAAAVYENNYMTVANYGATIVLSGKKLIAAKDENLYTLSYAKDEKTDVEVSFSTSKDMAAYITAVAKGNAGITYDVVLGAEITDKAFTVPANGKYKVINFTAEGATAKVKITSDVKLTGATTFTDGITFVKYSGKGEGLAISLTIAGGKTAETVEFASDVFGGKLTNITSSKNTVTVKADAIEAAGKVTVKGTLEAASVKLSDSKKGALAVGTLKVGTLSYYGATAGKNVKIDNVGVDALTIKFLDAKSGYTAGKTVLIGKLAAYTEAQLKANVTMTDSEDKPVTGSIAKGKVTFAS